MDTLPLEIRLQVYQHLNIDDLWRVRHALGDYPDRQHFWRLILTKANSIVTYPISKYPFFELLALNVSYVYLSNDERQAFANAPHQYLIQQVQMD